MHDKSKKPTSYVFLWQQADGTRRWDAIPEDACQEFLEKILEEDAVPASVMAAYAPILFHWVWPKFHNHLSDVEFPRIDRDILGSQTEATGMDAKPRNGASLPEQSKFGWLAPDGRYFHCEYTGHMDEARHIVGELQRIDDPERHLEDLGWAKIYHNGSYAGTYAVGMGPGHTLTDQQVLALQRLGLDRADGVSGLLLDSREQPWT